MAARLGQIIYWISTAVAVLFLLMAVGAYIEIAISGFPTEPWISLVAPLSIVSMAGTSWVAGRGLLLGLTGK
jgi:hypothetical protein